MVGVDFSTVIYFFVHLLYQNPHPKPSQILGLGASVLVSSFLLEVSAHDQFSLLVWLWGASAVGIAAVIWIKTCLRFLTWWVYFTFLSHLVVVNSSNLLLTSLELASCTSSPKLICPVSSAYSCHIIIFFKAEEEVPDRNPLLPGYLQTVFEPKKNEDFAVCKCCCL